jgi:hypothetical protein
MMKEEIWEARTKKLPAIRKTPLYKWRIRMRRLTWNRTPTQQAKFADEAALRPGLFRLRRPLLRGTSFSGFLEFASARLRRHHRLQLESAERHNEPPLTVTTAARFGGSADDRSTPPFL